MFLTSAANSRETRRRVGQAEVKRASKIKAISDATNRNEMSRVLRIVFDLFSQVIHVRVDHAVRDEKILTPHRFAKLVHRQYLAAASDQGTQQLEFESSDLDVVAVFPELASLEINLQTVKFIDI